jgi:predicted DNA-binding transcriptional regulator YafY
MKKVERIGEKRDGEKEFADVDLKTYTQRVFSMYGGEESRITLRFINPLLDTMVERFGTNAVYSKVDDTHSSVTVKIEVSDQFFGWLLGFGKRVKLVSPEPVVDKFKQYLNKINDMYD